MASNKLTISQSLHGYQDGHRLIASSIQLEAESKMAVRVLSDMAGSMVFHSQDSYLTGYPLIRDGVFVIARTWNAPEMSRPGCVWTHSLYFRFQEIFHLGDLGSILKIFRRPDGKPDINFYSKDLEMEISNASEAFELRRIDTKAAASTLNALYGHPSSLVVLEAESSTQIEYLTLELWRQQWPRLRRNFSFCTQSTVERQILGQPFDLQICPPGYGQKFKAHSDLVIVETNIPNPPFVDALLLDLIQGGSSVRQFLYNFGSSLLHGRSGMLPLMRILDALNLSNNQERLIRTLELAISLFPKKEDAKPLKTLLLSVESFPNIPEGERIKLGFIVSTDSWDAFDSVAVKPLDRFEEYFKHYPNECLQLLNDCLVQRLNEVGMLVIETIAFKVNDVHIVYLNRSARPLLRGIVTNNPNIATYPAFWEIPDPIYWENIDMLLHSSLRKKIEWKSVLRVLLQDERIIPNQLIDDEEFCVPATILTVANEGKPSSIVRYSTVLVERPVQVIDWLNECPEITFEVLLRLPLILDPNSKVTDRVHYSTFLKLVPKNFGPIPSRNLLNLKVFLLCIGLRLRHKNSIVLLEFAFEEVYFAALNNKLDYELWRKIEPHTPALPWWKEWDRCKKLRIAVAAQLKEIGLHRDDVKYLTSDKDLLKELKERFDKA